MWNLLLSVLVLASASWTTALSHWLSMNSMIPKLQLDRAVILPDCSMQAKSCYFSRNWFKEGQYNELHDTEVLQLPNIYEMNDKRYEVRWLNYMRSLQLEQYSPVVADSGSAEAILRYLETPIAIIREQLDNAGREYLQKLQLIRFILIDPPDIYTAGERHGRDFRISSIHEHCCKDNLKIVSTCPVRRHEVYNLAAQLDVNVTEWTSEDELFEDQLMAVL